MVRSSFMVIFEGWTLQGMVIVDAPHSIFAPEVQNRGSYSRVELNLSQEQALKKFLRTRNVIGDHLF